MTIQQLYNQVSRANIEEIAIKSLIDSKEAIADLNLVQMFAGIRSDGSEILPTYSDRTIHIKELKGQPFDRVTLRDKGNFYEGTYTDITGAEVVTSSHDWKTEMLNKKYSTAKGNIFGLSDKYKQEYIIEYLKPAFKRNVEELLGLKFD